MFPPNKNPLLPQMRVLEWSWKHLPLTYPAKLPTGRRLPLCEVVLVILITYFSATKPTRMLVVSGKSAEVPVSQKYTSYERDIVDIMMSLLCNQASWRAN